MQRLEQLFNNMICEKSVKGGIRRRSSSRKRGARSATGRVRWALLLLCGWLSAGRGMQLAAAAKLSEHECYTKLTASSTAMSCGYKEITGPCLVGCARPCHVGALGEWPKA